MGRKENERLRRDQAGVGPYARDSVGLVALKELNKVKIADGEPDIRGWEVRTLGGREIGTIEDLLLDPERGEVVMLDIDLKDSDRHSMVPIRVAQINRSRKTVVIDSADVHGTEDLPSLRRGQATTDDDAARFRDQYERAYGERGWDSERDYHVRRPGEDLRFRRAAAAPDLAEGGRTDREVLVDRRTGDADEEEVVVERRPVIMEEVVVRRRAVEPSEERGTEPPPEQRL